MNKTRIHKYITFIFFVFNWVFSISTTHAQTIFQKKLSPLTTTLLGVLEITGDGYYFSGYHNDNGSFTLLIKTDSSGNLVWSKKIGSHNKYNSGYKMHLGPDGNIYIAATVDSANTKTGDLCLYSFDKNGNLIFNKRWSSPVYDYGTDIAFNNNSSIICGVMRDYFGSNGTVGLILSLDSLKNMIWTKRYKYTQDLVFTNVIAVQGGYIVSGMIGYVVNNIYDAFCMMLDETGNIIWSKSYHSDDGFLMSIFDLLPDYDNNMLLAGLLIDQSGIAKPLIHKIDLSGNLINTKVFDLGIPSEIRELNYSNNGGFVFSTGSNCRTILTDNQFNIIEHISVNPGFTINIASVVVPTDDGGYLAAGSVNSSSDGLIIKYDSTLNAGCNTTQQTQTQYSIPISVSNIIIQDSLITLNELIGDSITTINVNETILCNTATGFNEINTNEIEVFPNPISDFVNINLKDKNNLSAIYVSDLTNRILFQINIENVDDKLVIDLDFLTPGLYFLTLSYTTGKVNSKKLIKL